MSEFNALFIQMPWLSSAISVVCLLLLALLANIIAKFILSRVIVRLSHVKNENANHSRALSAPIAARLANIVPVLVMIIGVDFMPALPEWIIQLTHNIAGVLITISIALAVSHLLDFINIIYLRRVDDNKKSIKGYIQMAKLVVYLIATILVISMLINKSPLILLSSLGAMAAVLMLIFQDTILSLVASIQVNSNGTVRIGDWIEIPQLGVDGFVIDIALHNITVQNWDKTYSIFPTKKIVSESFKNWRGMQESGGRRIKRSIILDQTSVRFLQEEDIRHLRKLRVLDAYLQDKGDELVSFNQRVLADGADRVNMRQLTNIGTFRAYIEQYLRHHPLIHQQMLIIVRQMQAQAQGVPLEVYCFSNDTSMEAYEALQSDIFDHLLAIVPYFGLRVFQQPTGYDVASLSAN